MVARLLRAARGGRGGVLLFEGEPGIGKTRLLEEAADSAASQKFQLARGAAEKLSRVVALGPLILALGESTQTLLAVPQLAGGMDARLRLLDAVQARLEERAARGPLLIALDDLQWADPTTLLALSTLVPELSSYPLVWILSRTAGRRDSGVARLYDVLERDGATRVTMGALARPAVAEIAADVLGVAPSPELLALVAGAGGNPFLLVELLTALRDEHAVQTIEGRAVPISSRLPHRIREIATRRLRGLSPRACHLLQVAAVLGCCFEADDVAEMFGEPLARLLPALDEAEAAGVVVRGPDLLSFRHDLSWMAVTETIAPTVRRALHRQAGQMMLERGSSVAAAAHLVEGARPGDAAALAGLDRAVREVLPTSPETAAELAVRAVELTVPGDEAVFDRVLRAVRALTTAGRLSEAVRLARPALRAATTPRGRCAQLRYELAYALLQAGHVAEAVAEAETAIDQGDLPDELRGLLEQVLSHGPLGSRARPRARQRAEAVLASSRQHSRPSLIAAHLVLTDVAWSEGRAADGLGHSHEAARIASSEPIRYIRPHVLYACTLMDMRRLTEAETALRIATDQITALGTTAHAAIPTLLRARLRLIEGRLDDAATEARAGLATADKLGAHLYDVFGTTVLATVALRRGDLTAADTYADLSRSHHVPGLDPMSAWWWTNWCPTLVAEAQGGPERTVDLLQAPYTDPGERRLLFMIEADAAAWLTRIALALGDRARANAVTATAERLARDAPDFPTLGASAAHAHGLLHHDTAALAHAATAHLTSWSRASAAEDLGVMYARATGATDRETAIHHLDQARDAYQQAGAQRDVARVRARLRRLGVRRRHWTQSKRPAFGWDSLTDTERNVAALAAQGLTNPQIAARMFISRDTVKFHLSQVFRKLDIASRVELAHRTGPHGFRRNA
ncbi:AAA ATPase-like protein [Actinoallomurus bryophytorum]|uniref:AAA ATPase-like protein n=2 Tax=Actinoallomurus bryophytorum TaxID=1490222 RepID=A0A543C157_9ACTN|nr:AAA ATPase-like protein [Actinoallomurus bryophytorum]